MCTRLLLVSLFAAAVAGAVAGEDKPVKAERFTYRLIGLFAPDREADLREAFKELDGLSLVLVNFDDAEITVEFVPGKAFPGVKPDQFVEQLDNRLRNASRHTFSVKPRRTIARDKLKQVVIPAAGLDCKGCCLAAYEAVARIDGVYQATASFKEGKITALIDPAKTDQAKLEEALKKLGVSLGKK